MNFATLHFDTYKIVTLLKERGFTKKQAEGIIETVREVTISGVATKEDLHDLETGLRAEITNVEIGLRSEIQKASNDNLKFQIIQTITMIGVMIALFQVIP